MSTCRREDPIEDAKALFRHVRETGATEIVGLSLTGYGKDLLMNVLGADGGVVETVAHARSAMAIFPDADVICDVGGTDVKIMLLRPTGSERIGCLYRPDRFIQLD